MAWRGPVLGEELSLCPGVVLAKRQLFLTESRLASLGEALRDSGKEDGGPAGKLALAASRYRRILMEPIHGAREMETALAGVRLSLDRDVYRPLLSSLAGRRMFGLWLFLAGIFLALSVAAGLGSRHDGQGGREISLPALACRGVGVDGRPGVYGLRFGPGRRETAPQGENREGCGRRLFLRRSLSLPAW